MKLRSIRSVVVMVTGLVQYSLRISFKFYIDFLLDFLPRVFYLSM